MKTTFETRASANKAVAALGKADKQAVNDLVAFLKKQLSIKFSKAFQVEQGAIVRLCYDSHNHRHKGTDFLRILKQLYPDATITPELNVKILHGFYMSAAVEGPFAFFTVDTLYGSIYIQF